MYMKFDNGFADEELSYTEDVCLMLDKIIIENYRTIIKARDVDIDGLGDKTEYLIGLGFTAMQRYIVDTLWMRDIEKDEALALGNPFNNEISVVRVINEASNWWKHEPEWKFPYVFKEKPRTEKRTKEMILDNFDYPYVMSNILAKISLNNELSLIGVIPHLIEWRSAVHSRYLEKELSK